ncbi:cytotoxin [Vibrio campbellii]|uniref:Cytotoxin n=2 Tax=Vibrio campbellii TaxID=680 RepID=A0AAE9SM88_9VIBR|nr:cytotoxin [Vibrio campbellii]MCC4224063.1 cytotoxin [Vibrio campbellii]UTZ24205.1 cytotoxin [Vibrio campbellii]UTZ28476.1 cytotoxin [Vibrio campbellii]UTZ33655.1 cytotoxin [Vibrio campbellii]
MRYQSAPVSSEETQETTAQRAARQRQERRAELTYSTDDYKRWNNNKNKTLDERNKEKQEANVTEAATEQKNHIHVGEEREFPDAILSPMPTSRKEMTDATGTRVLPSDLLGSSFNNQCVSAEIVAHQMTSLSPATKKEVEESGELVFSGMQYKHAHGTVGTIEVIDTFAGQQPDQKTSQMAYWVAQGKYLDIPKHPDPHRDHLYVFTPNFSGCSFVVDDWSDDLIRVYHVEGSKEDKQYNDVKDHRNGLINYMSFRDYGFYQKGNTTIKSVNGFAFMRYNTQARHWEIHYQKQEHAPALGRPTTSAKTLFSSEKHSVKVMVSKESRVVETGTIAIKR